MNPQNKNLNSNVGWNAPPPIAANQPPYPNQSVAHPPQPMSYPLQPASYTNQAISYPPQSAAYPNQSAAYAPQAIPVQPGFGVTYAGHPQANPPPYSMSPPVYSTAQSVIADAEAPKENDIPDNFGSSFSSVEIRHRFVRKVYFILTLQLLVTFGVVLLFVFNKDVKLFLYQHTWTIWLSYAVFLVTYLSICCCTSVRRKFPGNIILLTLFTLALSYMTGATASVKEPQTVLTAVGVTMLICFLISMFAIQTRFDFTGCGVYLLVASLVVFIIGIVALVARIPKLNLLYAGLFILLFCFYLIYDTQRIIGGRKHDLSPEEHIIGALMLYLDIVYIFMGVLSFSK